MTASLPSPVGQEIRTLTIPVTPVGKPRMTQRDKWRKRSVVVAYRSFADALRFTCAANRFTIPPERLAITFHLPMPASWSRVKRSRMRGMPHQQKPDLDNLVKAVLDALLDEDCSVWSLGSLEKRWAETGAITFSYTLSRASAQETR